MKHLDKITKLTGKCLLIRIFSQNDDHSIRINDSTIERIQYSTELIQKYSQDSIDKRFDEFEEKMDKKLEVLEQKILAKCEDHCDDRLRIIRDSLRETVNENKKNSIRTRKRSSYIQKSRRQVTCID